MEDGKVGKCKIGHIETFAEESDDMGVRESGMLHVTGQGVLELQHNLR